MELNEDIVRKFIAGDCEKEEESFVRKALRDEPEYLNRYLRQHSFLMDQKYEHRLPEGLSKDIFEQIHVAIDKRRKRKHAIQVKLGSVAAIIVVLMGFWYFDGAKTINSHPVNLAMDKKIIKRNTSDTIQHWILPDHSTVTAMKGAVLTYSNSFNKTKRHVHLTGEAEFDIVHNSQKPFTVFSNKIATTVLGTRFSVDANREKIAVKLYEGKVMVKKTSGKFLKPLYLHPGNAVVYMISTDKFLAISNFDRPKPVTPAHPDPDKVAQITVDSEVIAFNNTTMEYAIDKLAEQYEVEIQYSPVDIEGVNLIAQVSRQQSLKQILSDISLTNGLTVKQKGPKVFILEKGQ